MSLTFRPVPSVPFTPRVVPPACLASSWCPNHVPDRLVRKFVSVRAWATRRFCQLATRALRVRGGSLSQWSRSTSNRRLGRHHR